MNKKSDNIHPVFDRILQRGEKEKFLNQKSKVLWFTGLSGSGKSTLAIAFEKELHKLGYLTQILDGDNIRTGINNNLGFSNSDRTENIRRIAEVSKLFINCGIISLNCFVSPTNEIRKKAKDIIGEKDFIEIYVEVPLAIAERRDVKGLYKKARKGEIKDFTGIDAPFNIPENPDIIIPTHEYSVNESVDILKEKLLPVLKY